MKKISKEIFSPYLMKPDGLRPGLEKPFTEGEYVVATETHIILFIRKDFLEEEYISTIKPPVAALNKIPIQNCDIPVCSSAIRAALDILPKVEEFEEVCEEIECEECDGDGEVYWEYQDRHGHTYQSVHDCPCCDGSGKYQSSIKRPTGNMVVQNCCFISLNGIFVHAQNMEPLLSTMDSLGIHKARILALRESSPCLIRLAEGIDFVFMPSHPYAVSSMPASNIVPIEL